MPPRTSTTNPDLGSNPLGGVERAINDLTRATLALAQQKTTDTNGWTVYNNGAWVEYSKRVTFSQTVSGAAVLGLSSVNLPVGVSSIGSRNLSYSYTTTGNAYDLSLTFEGPTSATTLNFTVRSVSGGSFTFTGWIDVILTER